MVIVKSGDKNLKVSVTTNIVCFMVLKMILDLNLNSNFLEIKNVVQI